MNPIQHDEEQQQQSSVHYSIQHLRQSTRKTIVLILVYIDSTHLVMQSELQIFTKPWVSPGCLLLQLIGCQHSFCSMILWFECKTSSHNCCTTLIAGLGQWVVSISLMCFKLKSTTVNAFAWHLVLKNKYTLEYENLLIKNYSKTIYGKQYSQEAFNINIFAMKLQDHLHKNSALVGIDQLSIIWMHRQQIWCILLGKFVFNEINTVNLIRRYLFQPFRFNW